MAEQNLNAQQVAAIDQKVGQHIAGIIEKMTLRKWAMESALTKAPGDPVPLAEKIYEFVVKPALEPIKPD